LEVREFGGSALASPFEPSKNENGRGNESSAANKQQFSQELFVVAQDRVLGSLGDAEFDHALGSNLDLLASRGIATHASFAIHEHEFAETRNGEAVLGILVSQVNQRFDGGNGLLFGETSRFSNGSDDL